MKITSIGEGHIDIEGAAFDRIKRIFIRALLDYGNQLKIYHTGFENELSLDDPSFDKVYRLALDADVMLASALFGNNFLARAEEAIGLQGYENYHTVNKKWIDQSQQRWDTLALRFPDEMAMIESYGPPQIPV